MLSRTAESLFWASRYMERADSTARKLEVGYRMSMMPSESGGISSEWGSILSATSIKEDFDAAYQDVNQANIEDYLVYNQASQASIVSCIRAARNNARSVRTALTTDVWTALNQAYLELLDFEKSTRSRPDLPKLCDWVKRQASTVQGAYVNNQLDNDGADFYHLGHFVERAGNTARVLDIKYHILLPRVDMLGGGVDNYQWATLLRALSSYRSFHWAYHGDFSPEQIADFLILNEACPRSLKKCVMEINKRLQKTCSAHGTEPPALAAAQALLERLEATTANAILSDGLHEFLIDFVASNNALADAIGESFMFGDR